MTFTSRLLGTIQQCQWFEHQDNHDTYRFGLPARDHALGRLKGAVRSFLMRRGVYHRGWVRSVDPASLDEWAPLFCGLDWLYDRLADEASRDLLVQLVAYRLMGKHAVRLPLSNPGYWNRIRQLSSLADQGDCLDIGLYGWKLLLHDLAPIGYPVRLYIRTPGVMAQFDLRQYCCQRAGLDVQPGDLVIDGGACYGDSALYFASRTGGDCRVISFEFVPANLKVYARNLALNPHLAGSIELVPRALWSTSGVPLYVHELGPGSSVSSEPSAPGEAPAVTTMAIDDLVRERGLDRVNLIKMDIEGAEYEALRGARETLEKFRPKLALCVYHAPVDFVRLARFIDDLRLDYRFYLGHFTIHSEETVLYAVPERAN